MQTKYDAPELRPVGQAEEVVMGLGSAGSDVLSFGAADFEFAQNQ